MLKGWWWVASLIIRDFCLMAGAGNEVERLKAATSG
jgi:hypothetical protein